MTLMERAKKDKEIMKQSMVGFSIRDHYDEYYDGNGSLEEFECVDGWNIESDERDTLIDFLDGCKEDMYELWMKKHGYDYKVLDNCYS